MIAPNKPKILPPQGTFPARLYKIIYIGTVKGEWKGKPTENYQVSITWELPTKTHVFKEGEEAKPFSMSKTLTLSMGAKSSLRPIVESMLGVSFTDEEAKGYDIDELLGMACLLGIAYEEDANGKKAIIKSFSQLPEGMVCPPAVNPAKILSYQNFDKEYFLTLPDWIKEKMEKTPEFAKMTGKAVPTAESSDIDASDVPF
jgi:hypothetical protein